jgi:hypothetical protein
MFCQVPTASGHVWLSVQMSPPRKAQRCAASWKLVALAFS